MNSYDLEKLDQWSLKSIHLLDTHVPISWPRKFGETESLSTAYRDI